MKGKIGSFKKALVTGATSGIGEAIAIQLAERGVDLLLTGRHRDRLDALAEKLRRKVRVEVLLLDLMKPFERKQLVKVIHKSIPDLVINNAGIGAYGELLSYETDEHLKILELNGAAVLELTAEAARTLATHGRTGVILNVSSVAATPVFPLFSVYSATKAFVSQLSESLDFELRPRGIRVLVACPGYVKTRFQERAGGRDFKSATGAPMDVQFAASEILRQVESGRRLHVFDWRYRLVSFLLRYLLPKSWVAATVGSALRQRIGDRSLIPVPKDETS